MRFCAYCPEDLNTADVKECVELMQKTIYSLEQDYDKLLKDFIQLRKEYKDVTGIDYRGN